MRLRGEWTEERLVAETLRLMDNPVPRRRERGFAEWLGQRNAAELQTLESALTARQHDGKDFSSELAQLWTCLVRLCPASAQAYAATDPQRSLQLRQAVQRLDADNESTILSQLTRP